MRPAFEMHEDHIASDRRVLRVVGDIDLATAPLLADRIEGIAARGERRIEIDIEGVRFIDSTGLTVFLRARDHLADEDGALVIAGATPRVRRILETTGLAGIIDFGPRPGRPG
jgi:anti-anti-sigma factor